MKSVQSVTIDLSYIEDNLSLIIDAREKNCLFIAQDAAENAEAVHQLVEGNFYDYTLSDKRCSLKSDRIVQPHSRNKHVGTISPNIYVGTLSLPVYKDQNVIGTVELEVQSAKTGYRNDYRDMLEFITEKCTDLLLQTNSPVSHHFETDFTRDSQTLYQKFAFIKSILVTDEFTESLHRIISAPVTRWKETDELKNVRNIRKFTNSNLKSLFSAKNRTRLPEHHYLRDYGLDSVPEKIQTIRKTDTVDTPENRFVKHALEVFHKFCSDINILSKHGTKLYRESTILVRNLESILHHAVFKEISRPYTLKINSPVLQRKEGYREILRVWLMFNLAARLIWRGGDDVYSGDKKDIAVLYEYWLFFKLLDLFQSLFRINPIDIDELIQETNNGLNLRIKQGTHTALSGIYDSGTRKLNVRFNYNRTFGGSKKYPSSGSWTTAMRPDYTLSLWPSGIQEQEAEIEELIVHIHFDAKYKIVNIYELFAAKQLSDEQSELDTEKQNSRHGVYKNADLLKMHAYRDAIRRTGGAYVLYPGDEPLSEKGFHEIIPGLGAFPVKPSRSETGISELRLFILHVIDHFINRASQREKLAYRVYDIHKNKRPNELREIIPENYGINRDLIPDETFIVIGFYKSEEHYKWIKENKLYNFRMGDSRGSLVLNKQAYYAKYLLLHTYGDQNSGHLWKIISDGPKVYAKKDLLKMKYPDPSQDYYLVFEIDNVNESDFKGYKWDFRELPNYSTGRTSALPFTASLTELMKSKL